MTPFGSFIYKNDEYTQILKINKHQGPIRINLNVKVKM